MTDRTLPIRRLFAFLAYRPLLPALAALIGGILSATYLISNPWAGPATAAGLLIAAFGFLAGKKKTARIALLVFLWGLGLFLEGRVDHRVDSPIHISRYADGPGVTLQGQVVQPVVYHARGATAVVKVNRIELKYGAYMPVEGLVSIHASAAVAPPDYGDAIEFRARLRKIISYQTPGVFDWRAFNHRRGIDVRANLNSPNSLKILARHQGAPLKQFIESIRREIRGAVADPQKWTNSGILEAIVLGDQQQIPKKTYDSSKKSGITHLYSISGMHISSIFGLVFLVVLRLLRLSPRACRRVNIYKASALAALPPAILYALIAGWKIATIRALVMVVSFAVALLIDRHRDLLSAMAGAALAILVVWPYSLYEAGFQLSFGASAAISLAAPRMLNLKLDPVEVDRLEKDSRQKRVGWWLKLSLFTTLSAILFTLPMTAWHFGFIAPYGLISNLFMVPLYTLVVTPAALAGALLVFVARPASLFFLAVSDTAVSAGVFLSGLIGNLPGALINVARPTGLEIFFYFVLLCSALSIRRRWAQAVFGVALAALIAIPVSSHLVRNRMENLRVTVIDVGQGLSQLVEFPGGETWLIDGGGSTLADYDVGERVVGPFLRARRIGTIDNLVNTHPHPDHFGGLHYVLEHFDVKRITLSPLDWSEDGDDRYARLVEKAKSLKETSLEIVEDDQKVLEIGGATVRWLYPPFQATHPDSEMNGWSINDRSMVIRVSYGDCSILLPSDIEADGETWLVESGAELESDVLVAPHHGSRSSSSAAFLYAVRPASVVIPVGRYNWWGLPSPEVLSRYEQMGIQVYRTDVDGTVEITCTSEKPEIRAIFKSR